MPYLAVCLLEHEGIIFASADYLKPTPESMEQVMGNGQLMAGFDDPEVMEAVNAIAQSPGAIQKYKSNAKVSPHAHLTGCRDQHCAVHSEIL